MTDKLSRFDQIIPRGFRLTMVQKSYKTLTITLLLAICITILFACTNSNDSSRVGTGSTTIGGSLQEARDWRPDFDEVEWYETLEEAVTNNELPEGHRFLTVNDHIALFEGEERVTFFFRSTNQAGYDVIAFYTGFLKREGDKTYYTPFFGGTARGQQYFRNVAILDLSDIGEIKYSITLTGHQFHAVNDDKTFIWGLFRTPEIYTLQIEGQSPTNIIPVEFNDEIIYFWYFEDLQTDKPLNFYDLNQCTEGELVITMGDREAAYQYLMQRNAIEMRDALSVIED